MRHHAILATLTAAIGLPVTAGAAVPSINAPPSGPGTETGTRGAGQEIQRGFETGAQIGAGFTDTYGLGLGARIGYNIPLSGAIHTAIPLGLYLGGNFTYYFGHNVTTATEDQSAHALFFGGEGGVKVFPAPHVEVRPYVFLGPAFTKQVNDNPFSTESKTRFGVQPGVLGAYHFGNAFLTAEAKWYITPDPGAFTLMGGAGWGFE
jgi:hypothetical protein